MSHISHTIDLLNEPLMRIGVGGYFAAFMVNLCLAFPSSASAQTTLGAQLAWSSDADLGLGVRGEFSVPQLPPPLRAFGSLDFFFPEGIHAEQYDVNAGVLYPVSLSDLAAHVGGGINLRRISTTVFAERESGTHLGLALWAGTRFGDDEMVPFIELRTELGSDAQIVLSGGVLF